MPHPVTQSPLRPRTSPRPIVILGPTAGGKSDLAVTLAEALMGEVLGADSMQVYRHMDAGTAKPEPELRARVPHHLIDIVEPTERFTVHDWLARAEPLIGQLQQRGVTPVIVGGTNLYLKALLEGMFEGPGEDAAFRAEMEALPLDELRRRLSAVDPAAVGRIDANDRRRTTRALEVFHLTGEPISAMQTQWTEGKGPRGQGAEGPSETQHSTTQASSPKPQAFRVPSAFSGYRHDPILIGLQWPPEAINPRINARVKRMFSAGSGLESLPDETERLERAGLLGPPGSQAREALGYKQVLQALRGEMTMDEAMERTKIETRRFAKQQRTWLKRYRGVKWLPAAEMTLADMADAAVAHILTDPAT